MNKQENIVDIRKDWFMNQHFTKEQLQQLYDWEQLSGKIVDIISHEGEQGFTLHHIEDVERGIDLCFMKEEYMLRRWAERLGYKTRDGKTAKQFEEEHGIKDEPIIAGKEVWAEDGIFVTQFGEKRLQVLSNKYAIVAKRTASNSYEILLLDSKEYSEYLEKNNQ